MNKRIIVIATVFGILAVILGAFGAHGLKKLISAEQLETWQTAVQYQFYHTLAMLFLSTFSRFKSRAINTASWFFTLGILLFSGSLYLISAKDVLGIASVNILGPLTPIGGLFFIIGWGCLLVATIKNK
ncbi:DUF423 domain-containing protein [Daejeonella lutea]|uniref:Uncharacterized membrane protein YgdD, TMEM256/DUF423 family n=1 Tax=Daejeonella lutea TaxID=572036 RepID=A0A1T5B835_9SPHI|nr:DUF423 domain-containing protein [Daejeonella lutea]SKB43386.1 Uncharacterized membrane protein YgdD, TMEM256/DUF423 family [Daejeonella lutea]